MTTPSPRVIRSNRLLAALPKPTLERIVPDLRLKSLERGQVLQPRGTPVEEVVFPVLGVASMVAMGTSGASLEVATIGCEGMVGLRLFLGGQKAVNEIAVQIPGHGLHLSAESFLFHVERERSLLQILLRYTQALLTQVAQCSACNHHHPVEARCARWLLQTHDRVTGDEFPLTHDLLSAMLGVRRATVTEIAGALQDRKLIRYHRGMVTIRNRKGLEGAACECYQLVSDEFDRLLGKRKRVVATQLDDK
ncbi:MAG TPA: Crp/Fnr family transcriptional regulator [Nitrospiraceae bacterium]|nr:Crp/Fnr family transcriptional regulator [Nitrospiraceae bacterium]